jgi:membrane-associated phospholipid phosphatase
VPQRPWVKRILASMGPDLVLLVLFLLTLGGLVSAYGASFKWVEGPIVISAGILLGLVAVSAVRYLPAVFAGQPGARGALVTAVRNTARDWAPFVGLMWAFQCMETYTGVVRQTTIDDALYRMDLAWFGVEPTVWAGRFFHPLLTDWMAISYGLYFVMPMLLATALSVRGRREDFREMSTAVVIQLGIGFVLCLLFPAGPPRYYEPFQHGVFTPPHLHSWLGIFELQQGAFDSADPLRTRSAFPSLHCSLAFLTLMYAWRFGSGVFPRKPRLYFWICLPLVISLWLSTIYLRHHWIPDILAGLALGFVANLIAPRLRRHWPRWPLPSRAGPGS